MLTTKLHASSIAPDWIPRPRLMDALEEGRLKPMILVSAPAGYGKSVLVTQWAARHPGEVAWVSLDERDSDLDTFVSYLLAAVRSIRPTALDATAQLLGGALVPPVAEIAASLANALDALDDPLVIVLEDYHLVRSAEVDELLATLVSHAPLEVTFLVVTRSDPALPLAVLRGHGDVKEVRAAELAFTPAEASLLLARVLGMPVSDATSSAWIEATEGWATGLRLYAEARRGDEPGPLLRVGPMEADAVGDFLTAEVLGRQPEWIRVYLLATSAVGSFSADLAEALVAELAPSHPGAGEGQRFVEYLRRRDLFVVDLGDDGTWLRFHHLFADLLRRRLALEQGEGVIDAIRHRAAGWFERREMIEEAIAMAASLESPALLGRLVARHGSRLVEREEWPRLEAWLARIPREVVEADPDLLVLEAWIIGEVLENPIEMRRLLDHAEAAIATRPPGSIGLATAASIEMLRGFQAFIEGDPHEAVSRARRGGTKMPPDLRRDCAFAVVIECVALQATGDIRAAVARAHQAMSDPRFHGTPFEPWTWALPYVFWLEADIDEVEHWGEVLESRGHSRGLIDTRATGRYFRGLAAYERNDLESAERYVEVVPEHRYQLRPIVYVQSEILRGLALVARGRADEAERIAAELTRFAGHAANPRLITLSDSFAAEIALASDRPAEAIRWAARVDIGAPRQEWKRHAPAAALVRALLAAESARALAQAEDAITPRLAFFERLHNRPRTAELLALLARVHEAHGRDDAARVALARAVALTQPGQAVRLVADAGPHLVGLLSRLDVTGGELDHVARIIQASPEHRDGAPGSPHDAPSRGGASTSRSVPAGGNVLTDREAQVLLLLDRRLSNKEIARELMVAPETVKKYTISIYRKLHVGGRRAASEKARTLGYLAGD